MQNGSLHLRNTLGPLYQSIDSPLMCIDGSWFTKQKSAAGGITTNLNHHFKFKLKGVMDSYGTKIGAFLCRISMLKDETKTTI